jgi:hypothetical protein
VAVFVSHDCRVLASTPTGNAPAVLIYLASDENESRRWALQLSKGKLPSIETAPIVDLERPDAHLSRLQPSVGLTTGSLQSLLPDQLIRAGYPLNSNHKSLSVALTPSRRHA